MGYGIIGDYIGTTIRDPFPHSLLRSRQTKAAALNPKPLILPAARRRLLPFLSHSARKGT